MGRYDWGRKELWVLQRGGSPDQRERRERERECVNRVQGSAQENHLPKPLTGKMREADYCKFLQGAELKD